MEEQNTNGTIMDHWSLIQCSIFSPNSCSYWIIQLLPNIKGFTNAKLLTMREHYWAQRLMSISQVRGRSFVFFGFRSSPNLDYFLSESSIVAVVGAKTRAPRIVQLNVCPYTN